MIITFLVQLSLHSLSETIEQLEAKVVEQQEQIDHLRKAERGRLVEGRKQTRILETLVNFSNSGFQLRRAHSFDLGKSSFESAYEEELTNLHMNVRNLKSTVARKEKREAEMETEVAVLLKEKQGLEKQLREWSIKAKVSAIKKDHASLDGKNFHICHFCDSVIHSEEEETGPVPKLLSSAGLLVDKEISILSEIDSQYKNLMEKYNTLLEHSRTPDGKCKRSGSLRRKPDATAQTPEKGTSLMDLPQFKGQAHPANSRFENSPRSIEKFLTKYSRYWKE